VQEALTAARSELGMLVDNPATPRETLAQSYGEMAGFYHAHHLYTTAEACYVNAETLAPTVFRWPYLLGYVYQQASNPSAAVTAYQRALRIRPDYAPAKMRLAEVHLELNQPEPAEPLLRKLVDVDEVRAAALFRLGRLSFDRKDYQHAVNYYQQALEARPQATRIHYTLAMAYRGLGDVERARVHLQQRGDGEPRIEDPLVDDLGMLLKGARPHLFRAIESVRAGHYEDARRGFSEALAIDPDNVNARVSYARVLYLMGDRAGARRELEEVLRRDSNHALGNFLMGLLVEEAGSQEAALGYYHQTLTADPEHSGAHYLLGNVFMREGKFAVAAQHYLKTLEQEPDHYPARLMAAMASFKTGASCKHTRAWIEEGINRHPKDTKLAFVLARLLACCPDDSGRDGQRALELAQTLYDEFNALENAETLAMAYAEVGRFDDAAVLQQNAIEATVAAGAFFYLPRLEENLALYQNGRICRKPWSAGDTIFLPPEFDAYGPFREYPTLHAY
jgi:tetratricopeptide (TPR) repeat protein